MRVVCAPRGSLRAGQTGRHGDHGRWLRPPHPCPRIQAQGRLGKTSSLGSPLPCWFVIFVPCCWRACEIQLKGRPPTTQQATAAVGRGRVREGCYLTCAAQSETTGQSGRARWLRGAGPPARPPAARRREFNHVQRARSRGEILSVDGFQ